MFGRGGGGFFGFGFFFGLEVFVYVFGFAAELFVGVFGKLFFDRGDASFFHVFVHVDIGGIGTLVIFELVLVATGLTSTIVLRTGDISLMRGNVLVHGIIFYFCLSLIYYIALYIATQAFLYITLLGSDFIELLHHKRLTKSYKKIPFLLNLFATTSQHPQIQTIDVHKKSFAIQYLGY